MGLCVSMNIHSSHAAEKMSLPFLTCDAVHSATYTMYKREDPRGAAGVEVSARLKREIRIRLGDGSASLAAQNDRLSSLIPTWLRR